MNKKSPSQLDVRFTSAARSHAIHPALAMAIVLFPILTMLVFAVGGGVSKTRSVTEWLLMENRPVELMTFALLLIGGIAGLALSRRLRQQGASILVVGFYLVFSVGLLITAMEEIAWGQWFFGFQTPTLFEEINAQGELTLHNIHGAQGRSELPQVAFGLGGCLGVWLSFRPAYRQIGASVILLSWFLIIVVFAGLDLYDDFFEIHWKFYEGWSKLDELVEMLIAGSAALYIWLNARTLAADSLVSRPAS